MKPDAEKKENGTLKVVKFQASQRCFGDYLKLFATTQNFAGGNLLISILE
jgi:hypothetical protein